MKILITRQTFIRGELVEPGDVVEVERNDYSGNLLNKAIPVPTAVDKKKVNDVVKAKAKAKENAKVKARTAEKAGKYK